MLAAKAYRAQLQFTVNLEGLFEVLEAENLPYPTETIGSCFLCPHVLAVKLP